MHKQTSDVSLIHCLHGNRIPVFDMDPAAPSKFKDWVKPRIRFTMALCETKDEYRYGTSVIFKETEQYCRKIGKRIAEGRAYVVPFLVIKKDAVTKDEAMEILYQSGYRLTNAAKHRIKRWKDHKFASEQGKGIFEGFVLDSGKSLRFEDIDTRILSEKGF